WRYVVDNLFGNINAVSCLGATHIPKRWDEQGEPYDATADDSAYATFQLDSGVIAHFNSSWAVRVRRDDLLTLQVDGTHGSAVAGLRRCFSQSRVNTPKPVWNPDIEQPINFVENWQEVPDNMPFDNAFKAQWEGFLKHVVEGGDYQWNLREGVKGVQLVEAGLASWAERRWVDLEALPQ
ncbi:MAG: Gfo/Idh/MocA family oxidoreductase, partial [Burkholderiaceae bacterium]